MSQLISHPLPQSSANLPLVGSPHYSFEFPHRHRFPMQKFALLQQSLREQGIAGENNLFRPGKVKRELLLRAHCSDYVDNFIQGKLDAKAIRRMGLPWSEGLVKRSIISPNGTLLAASLALRHGLACHLAGGTHHAHYDFASGYCIFNDLAVAALCLLQQSKVQKVLIFDCDVHQGDGTATILENEPNIVTCSIHCEKNFPHRKATSDFDFEVPPATEDDAYLEIVDRALHLCLENTQPDLVIYDAGVDIFVGDPLGQLNISSQGIRRRDAYVLQTLTNLSIPVATVIGGGYDRDQKALAARHAIVVEEAHNAFHTLHS